MEKLAKNIKQQKSSFFTSTRWAYVGSFLFSVLLIYLAFRFQQHLSHFKSLGIFSIFLLNLISSATVIIPEPAIVSVVVGGKLYPPILVGLAAALGAGIGNMIGYFLGRSGKHIVLNHTESKWYIWIKSKFHRYATLIIFVFALIPNPIFDGVAILAGITEYPPIKFFLLMLVARLIRDTLLALLGAKL
ncbi:MAG TPA: VTT domain-containing protein [Patescibacteria group bacterium]